MLPCPIRLTDHADFERVRLTGKSWRHPLLSVGVAPNTLTHHRYGFIVTKRLGGAVQRNRVKRLLREAVQHLVPRCTVKVDNENSGAHGYDVVIIARNEAAGKTYQEIADAVAGTLTRAAILNDKT